ESVLQEVGRLDPSAIAQVREESWLDIRDSDELHELLQTLIALPQAATVRNHEAPGQLWRPYFEELLGTRRAAVAEYRGLQLWTATDRAKSFTALFPDARLDMPLVDIESAPLSPEEGAVVMVRGWMQHLGPTTARELSDITLLPEAAVERALLS